MQGKRACNTAVTHLQHVVAKLISEQLRVVRRCNELAHDDAAPVLHAHRAQLERLLNNVARKLLLAQLREATLQMVAEVLQPPGKRVQGQACKCMLCSKRPFILISVAEQTSGKENAIAALKAAHL